MACEGSRWVFAYPFVEMYAMRTMEFKIEHVEILQLVCLGVCEVVRGKDVEL